MVNANSLKNLEKRGRTKGAVGKMTKVKEMIFACFDIEEMKAWKKDHYSEFFRGVVSLCPKDIGIDPDNKSITIKIETFTNDKNDPNGSINPA